MVYDAKCELIYRPAAEDAPAVFDRLISRPEQPLYSFMIVRIIQRCV